ncbi:uncharacterized protein EI90DRAFT_3014331 [Cantharellus anzutake]|uniref:uncharacterized protein n=1 Tax=Cantharellus anzutake TaxID=1750568 RepID=UPI001905CC2D|nr:uncharacterized protein EI90DRAFT_3014331 [Cantharellus anzutake]KAF8335672.1 hypothetical protein EI90DRAFT_3014331 [Cantharellus anzutake]
MSRRQWIALRVLEAPSLPEKDPPDVPLEPNRPPNAQIPDPVPDPTRSGEEMPIPSDGLDKSVEIVDTVGDQASTQPQELVNNQLKEIMQTLMSLVAQTNTTDDRLDRLYTQVGIALAHLMKNDEDLKEVKVGLIHPNLELVQHQPPINTPQLGAPSAFSLEQIVAQEQEPNHQGNQMDEDNIVVVNNDYIQTTKFVPVPGHPSALLSP